MCRIRYFLEDMADIVEDNPVGCAMWLLMIFTISGSVFGKPIVSLITARDIVIEVTNKERISNSGGGKYLVWTEGEVFENTDSNVFLKWDSSDLYGDLEIGGRYEVKVCGFRFRPFSWYRNIIRINERID